MSTIKMNYKGYRLANATAKKGSVIEIREITTDGELKLHSVPFTDETFKEAVQKAKDWVDGKKEPKPEVKKEEPKTEDVKDSIFVDEKE